MIPSVVWAGAPGKVALADSEQVVELDRTWQCRLGDDPSWAARDLDEAAWTALRLPDLVDEANEIQFAGDQFFWCRLNIFLPREARPRDFTLLLGPVRGHLELYFNGGVVGRRGSLLDGEDGNPWRQNAFLLPADRWVSKEANVLALRLKRNAPQVQPVGRPFLLGSSDTLWVSHRRSNLWRVWFPGVLGATLLLLGMGHLAAFAVGTRENRHVSLAAAGILAGLTLAPRIWIGDGGGWTLPLERWGWVLLIAAAVTLAWHVDSALRTLLVRWHRYAIGAAGVLALVVLSIPSRWVPTVAAFLALAALLLSLGFGLYAAVLGLLEGQRQALAVLLSWTVSVLLIGYDIVCLGMGEPLFTWPYAVALVFVSASVLTGALEARDRRLAEHEAGLALLKIRDLSSIHRFGTGINSVLDLNGFLDDVIQEAAHQLSVRRCSLVLDEEDGTRIRASVGLPVEAREQKMSRSHGIAGWVLRHGQPLTRDRLAALSGERPQLTSARYVTSSFISWPLARNDRIVGVLNVSDKDDGSPFTSEDETMVSELADRLALVVDNALFYRGLKEENDRLRARLVP